MMIDRPLSSLTLFVACLAVPLAAVAHPLPQWLPGESKRLLVNGGFDSGDDARHPIGWNVSGANVAGIRIINRQADRTAGIASLEIHDADGQGAVLRSERLIAIPEGRYTLSGKLKVRQGAAPTFSLSFQTFERKATGKPVVVEPKANAEWHDVAVEAVAPADAAHVIVSIESRKGQGGVSHLDAFDLQLAPLPYDPAIGTARELFLDDHRIESAYHVGRVTHKAKTAPEPVIRADKPWEGSAYIYGTVFKENDKFRMWYTAYNAIAPNYHTAYAESDDGLTWRKPSLGRVEFEGSKENNLLVSGNNMIAFNPDAPPERRYTSLAFKVMENAKPNETLGYYIAFSPDGFTWTSASDKPVLFDGDVSNINYDPITKRYLASIKKRMFTSRTPGIYERSAFVSTSEDGLTWTSPRLAVMGDYADDGVAQSAGGHEAQIYGMPIARYESVYVGFPWVFYIHDYVTGESAATGDGPVDIQIAASRDFNRWERPIRSRLIEPGKPGSWNDGAHYTAGNFIVDDQTITMYYAAFNNDHGGADLDNPHRGKNTGQSGIAVWRRDGWVSLTNASTPGLGNPGQLTTKPITFEGSTLHLNAVVREGGSIRVEVLDADGKPIDGYTADQAVAIEGDHLDVAVKWTGDAALAKLTGRPVKLRFHMVNADLFSYWVAR